MKVKLDEQASPVMERQHFGEGVVPGAFLPGESVDVEREQGEALVASDLPIVKATGGRVSPQGPRPGQEETSPPPVEPTTAQEPAEGQEESA